MVIDAHSHYMPPDVAQNTAFFKQFWSDANHQLKLMDANYVDQAVLLYPTSDAHVNMGGWGIVCRKYNQGIGDLVAKHPTRFIGGGIIPVDDPAQIVPELRRIRDLGLRVISLASSYNGKYLDDEMFCPVFEFASANHMPIHVHAQIMNPIGEDRVADPLLTPVLEYVLDVSMCIGKMMMNNVLLKYPDVSFIFAHYGGVLPLVKERFDTTYHMLRKRNFVKDLTKPPSDYFKNLYFDMSGSKSAAALSAALEMTDVSHVLWGSDFPANQDFSASLGVVSSSVSSSQERQNITGGNILRLLKQN
jgi:aminocarboxymuconate-semialdehyde decarboxylase